MLHQVSNSVGTRVVLGFALIEEPFQLLFLFVFSII